MDALVTEPYKKGPLRNFISLFFWGLRYRFLGGACRSDVWGFPMSVSREDVVLEIGGGANPRLRSDIILEKFWSDRLEGKKKFIDERPYLLGDGCNIPMKDKCVDYIICRHVLEHVNRPEDMLDEFQRVARKGGFIAAPSRHKEEVTPAVYHNWYVFHEGDKIVLEEKPAASVKRAKPQCDNPSAYEEFRHEWLEESHPLRYDVRRLKSPTTGNFEHAVVDIPEAFCRNEDLNVRRKALRFLRKTLYSTRSVVDLYSLLQCPICKTQVLPAGTTFCCANQHQFPNVESVPILLREALMGDG